MTPIRWASAVASSNACVTSSVGSSKLGEDVAELVADLAAGDRVERAERLVEQQHARVAGERAGERDPLALAARELRRPGVGEVRDPEALEQVWAVALAGEPHVPRDREVWEQPVVLGEVPDASSLRAEMDAVLRRRATARRRARSVRRIGRSSPATVRSSDVLPAPDGPTIATVSAPRVSAARRSNDRRARAMSISRRSMSARAASRRAGSRR